MHIVVLFFFFFSSRRRHTRLQGDWSSDVCSSDLATFRGDPSYEVRAAALLALFQADSTKATRDSAVAWGLATPSYQDVIEESAYRIIAQGGDTAAIPALEARLGGGRFAAHVLAALASRGSAHALDVLAAHLDDERRSEEHTSELQSPCNFRCRLLLEKTRILTWAPTSPG